MQFLKCWNFICFLALILCNKFNFLFSLDSQEHRLNDSYHAAINQNFSAGSSRFSTPAHNVRLDDTAHNTTQHALLATNDGMSAMREHDGNSDIREQGMGYSDSQNLLHLLYNMAEDQSRKGNLYFSWKSSMNTLFRIKQKYMYYNNLISNLSCWAILTAEQS